MLDNSKYLPCNFIKKYFCSGWRYVVLPKILANYVCYFYKSILSGINSLGDDICTLLTIEEDTACQCNCNVQPSDCKKDQVYSSATCDCICQNVLEKSNCLVMGKNWDDKTCSCSCPSETWTPCTTGYIFDAQNTCSCKRIQDLNIFSSGDDACNNFLALAVIIFVFFAIGSTVLLLYMKNQLVRTKRQMCQNCRDKSISRQLSSSSN